MSVSLVKRYGCPCEALSSARCTRHDAVTAARIRATALQQRARRRVWV